MSFEINEFEALKSLLDLAQIQILEICCVVCGNEVKIIQYSINAYHSSQINARFY